MKLELSQGLTEAEENKANEIVNDDEWGEI